MLSTAGGQLKSLLTSPTFLACVFSWLCAQFLKTVIKLFSGKVHSIGELFELMLWRTGSMPSSHSAVVACVCICVGLKSGLNSDVFIVSFILYFITIRDALGVRLSNGIQAKRINEIISFLFSKDKQKKQYLNKSSNSDNENLVNDISEVDDFNLKEVKEVNGHTPMEVIVGSLLGFFIGIAFSVLK